MSAFPSDDELIDIGTEVHKTFPNTQMLCRYGAGWEGGEMFTDLPTYCHAGLMSFSKSDGLPETDKGPVVITNKVMYSYKRLDKEKIERYTSFLMNDSVFSECIVNKDVSKVAKQGVIVRTDKAPNLVAATCIATRQAWEHPHVMDTTLALIDEGVPPRIAEIVSYMATLDKDGGLNKCYTEAHSPVRLGMTTKQVIKSILGCRLDLSVHLNNDTYQEMQNYGGIPDMWLNSGEKVLFDPQFYSKGERPRNKDPFGLIKRVEKKATLSNAEQVMETFKEFLV